MDESAQSTPRITAHRVVVERKPVWLAVGLAMFFGPLGLLYVTVAGGTVMLIAQAINTYLAASYGVVTGFVLCHTACVFWALTGAQTFNDKMKWRAIELSAQARADTDGAADIDSTNQGANQG